MQLVLLVIVFGLLFAAVALLSIVRAKRKRAERVSQDPEKAAGTGPLTPRQKRARQRRARINAARSNPVNARTQSVQSEGRSSAV